MSREDWAQVKSILEQALDLPAEEWARFLDEACGSDERLRGEVDSLLQAHQEIAGKESYWVGRDDEPGRIDRYEILRPLDAGGMGVVYLANQLEPIRRQVAIKLIRSGIVSDELLARFEIERQALAAMNHPHIAQVLDAGSTAEGRPYCVMEYVPGLPITDFCKNRDLDTRQRLELMLRVLDALQHAHDAGIVHRDLKPSNILVMLQDGKPVPKVIDFGVAKTSTALSKEGKDLTRTGQIIGTPEYMSPEQARGRAVDQRTDMWSVGCLLFRLLTDRSPFDGDSVGDIIAAVLTREPDWSRLPDDTHPAARRLIRRCLAKDPDERQHSAADAALELREAISGSLPEETGRDTRPRSRPWLAITLLMALVAVVAWWIGQGQGAVGDRAELRKMRLAVRGLQAEQPHAPVLSPDGSTFVYVLEQGLHVRRLNGLEVAPLAGTAGAEYPFWSPDSRSIGYFTPTAIRRVPAAGGTASTILDLRGEVVRAAGAVWTVDDTIVYSRGDTSLFEVPARGGERRLRFESDAHEHLHAPALLPDGRSLVFGAHAGAEIDLMVLSGEQAGVVLHVDGHKLDYPAWSPSGHILFQRTPTNAGLWALPFSPATRQAGAPMFVAAGGGYASVALDGTMLYVPGAVAESVELVWVDRDGRLLERTGVSDVEIRYPDLSPDGKRVVASHRSRERFDVWVHDLELKTRSRVTSGDARYYLGRWAPDGRTVFGHAVRGESGFDEFIWSAPANGRGPETDLGPGAFPEISGDGRHLVYVSSPGDAGGTPNLQYKSVAGGRPPALLADSPFVERSPVFSPDDRHIAYMSDESGIWETWLMRFPEGDPRWQVSQGGGRLARWSETGDRLYYVNRNRLYEVDVTTRPAISIGPARELFSGSSNRLLIQDNWGYDVAENGARFLVVRSQVPDEDAETVVLVQDWFEQFRVDSRQ